MSGRRIIALGAATLAVALTPAAALAAGGPAVTIRIEGVKKTLLLPTSVRTRSGSITKFGAPAGRCPAASAQGALDVATRGKWVGKWYASFTEYFISSILGEKPKGSDYWTIFADNKATSLGACDLKLHPGEQLLFADTNGKPTPAALTAPHSAVAGKPFTAKLIGYTAKGKALPLAGVAVTGNGIPAARTNSSGAVTITDKHAGVLVLRSAPNGHVRTETIVHVAA